MEKLKRTTIPPGNGSSPSFVAVVRRSEVPSGKLMRRKLGARATVCRIARVHIALVARRAVTRNRRFLDPETVRNESRTRELHRYPNADEWQYYIAGQGRMTLFENMARARTADFGPGDVGYVPKTPVRYIENTGNVDLVFLQMFKTDRYQDLSLNDWPAHLPPELVAHHLGVEADVLTAIPRDNLAIVPQGAA